MGIDRCKKKGGGETSGEGANTGIVNLNREKKAAAEKLAVSVVRGAGRQSGECTSKTKRKGRDTWKKAKIFFTHLNDVIPEKGKGVA